MNSDESMKGAAPAFTMYLDQSAHLDWDWIQTFDQNLTSYPPAGTTRRAGVYDILDGAVQNLADPNYYYTICEMGYLQAYVAARPGIVETLQSFGNRFQALSGGITSADCQVCSGEGFIRNYLVGRSWLRKTLGMSAKPHCWLPDDFGQGPELPALLNALGFASVAFMRVPGEQDGDIAADFTKNGLDFIWEASDGSSVYAHWLTVWYNLGNALEINGVSEPAAMNTFIQAYQSPHQQAGAYSAARTPFMYVPIDDDFSLPIVGLADVIAAWNSDQPSVQPGGAGPTSVGAVQGTFDQFMTQVIAASQAAPGTLMTRRYNGTPYWTGYYASRPELKLLHNRCVRALTAAEIFGVLAQQAGGILPATFWDDVDTAWNNFVPSTHHDYICGTAVDEVYRGEQLDRLNLATTSPSGPPGALALRTAALAAVAETSGPAGSVVIGNSLGFERYGVVEFGGTVPAGTQSFAIGGASLPVQQAADGGTLLFAPVPGLGYATGIFSASEPVAPPPAPFIQANPDGSHTLSNQALSATVSATGALLNLIDQGTGQNILLPHGGDTDLGLYADDGGIYRFGNEEAGGTLQRDSSATLQPVSATILENGALRVRLQITAQCLVGTSTCTFTREYALTPLEPFLRVTVSGAAPSGYSVMATVPFAGSPMALDHGTAGHWTSVQPGSKGDGSPFWPGPVFRATHDFVLPRTAQGSYVGAIYHAGTPAWAIDGGLVIGCLLRNTPKNELGAFGTDPDSHTQSYAIRVPTGLQPPESGLPLREALAFSTSLQAAQITSGRPRPVVSGGIAAPMQDTPALVTVVKPGTYDRSRLILRVQQPTNAPLALGLAMFAQPAAATLVTAAEEPWTGGGAVGVGFESSLSIQMEGAIATVEISMSANGAQQAKPAEDVAPAPQAAPAAAARGLMGRLLAWIARLLGR